MASKRAKSVNKTSSSNRIKVLPKKSIKKSVQKNFWTPVRLLLGAIFALVVLLVLMSWYGNEKTLQDVQSSMRTYLEDKYSKDFIVEKPRLTDAGFAVPGLWRSNAHPKDDTTLQFEVGKHQDKEQFFDYYTGTIWASQERPRVEAFLKTLYSTVPDFTLRTHIATDASPDPIRAAVPSLDDAIAQYKEKFFYSLTLKFNESSLTNDQKEEYGKKFTEVASYVNSRGAGMPSLRFRIDLNDGSGGYFCDTGYDRNESIAETLASCLDKKIKG